MFHIFVIRTSNKAHRIVQTHTPTTVGLSHTIPYHIPEAPQAQQRYTFNEWYSTYLIRLGKGTSTYVNVYGSRSAGNRFELSSEK